MKTWCSGEVTVVVIESWLLRVFSLNFFSLFFFFYLVLLSTLLNVFFFRLNSHSFKAVNSYRKCSLSIITHMHRRNTNTCTHLLFEALQCVHLSILFMTVLGVIHMTDVSFLSPLRNRRINWPPLSKSTWCLSEACLLPSQSRKSRKCWERKLYLAALLWLALAEKWNPDALCNPRARTSFPVLQHPGLGNTVH